MLKFIKKPWVIIAGIILLVVIFGIYKNISGQKNAGRETAVVKKETLSQEISVTGKVEPVENVDLAFEKIGKVMKVNVAVGDKVKAGDVLAEQGSADLQAQLLQAQAAVESAVAVLRQYQATRDAQAAKLDQLKAGTRSEEISVKESELEQAQEDLSGYYRTIPSTISDAYTKSDDAVRLETSSLFSGGGSTAYSLSFYSCDQQAEIDSEDLRMTSEKDLQAWQNEISSINPNSAQVLLDTALQDSINYMSIFKKLLERINDTLSMSCGSLTSSTRDTYLTSINAGRTNVVTAISTATDLQQTIAAQKITVQKVQNELNLEKAGSAPQEITAQEATLRQAEANIDSQQAQIKQAQANKQNIEAQIAKGVIHSPIDGTVTTVDTKVGEIVSANAAVISVISGNRLEIKADVPEVDIAKVKVDNPASVTLDAYGSDVVFTAKVVSIDPAETVLSGVIYYQVKLVFDNESEKLKTGMTANVVVLTAKKENVLAVPQRAVVEEADKKYVRVLSSPDATSFEKREVKIGINGSSGLVEIVSGISEGEIIITFQK